MKRVSMPYWSAAIRASLRILAEVALGCAGHYYANGIVAGRLAEYAHQGGVLAAAVAVYYAFGAAFFEQIPYKGHSLFVFFFIISHTEALSIISLAPFYSCRRLAGYVVDHAACTFDFVYYAGGYCAQHLMGYGRIFAGHEVGGFDGPQAMT